MADSETSDILIVDDLPEKHQVYRAILDEMGQNLVSAASGSEALKEVLKRDFAVILLDVNMPGMNGFETAHLIRQRKRSAHTPIIFLTAFADEVQSCQGYATGGVDYMSTPVVPEILRAKVRVFVELFRMRQQVAQQAIEQTRRAAAEEAARRSAFLAEASRALTSSLEFEATVRGLLRLVVPTLGDFAAVSQTDGPASAWVSEAACLQMDSNEVVFTTLDLGKAPNNWLRECHDRILASGNAESLHNLDLPFPFDVDPAVSSRRINSAIVLPLTARMRTIGVLLVVRCNPENRFRPADRALVEDLAERAGIALDNARLYRDIQENDRRKNEFLAMLSHELRNPLAPVRNAVHVIRQCGVDHPQISWARDVIDRQVTHLVRLVDDLLDVSRITRGKIRLQPELIDLASVVTNAVETSRPLIQRHAHELSVSVADEPMKIEGDPARLSQVLSNLLNNAAKYTPDGGQIWLSLSREDNEAVFRVRDTGAGIPPEMLARVFDLFTQMDQSLDRAQGGLGVGLTLVRRLVEMHGGRVEAFSAGIGEGSEFVIHLPLKATETKDPVKTDVVTNESALVRQRQVLIVDDNRDAVESLAMLLEQAGHEVHVAYDGPNAVKATLAFQPDVIFLDLGLPGFDGYEVARRVRSELNGARIRLVAVSGYGQEEDRERCRQVGFDDHLTKPVDFSALERLMSTLSDSIERPANRAATS